MQQVSKNVFVETGFAGCNVGVLVTPDGLVMIDTPFSPTQALEWKEELAKKGQIIYIINTEHHIDHTTGNYFYPGTVVATEAARTGLDNPELLEMARRRALELAPEAAGSLAGFRLNKPTITFSDRLSLFVGGQTLHLISLPGHTASGLVVHIPDEGVVFAGDDIIHRQGPLFHESLPGRWRKAIDQIEALKADVIVPGHGGVCDSSYIPEFRQEFETSIELVKEAIARGLTKEQAAQQVDLLGRYYRDGIPANYLRFQSLGIKRLYSILTGEIKEE